jgi:uncharacterized protein (DUF2141 family)
MMIYRYLYIVTILIWLGPTTVAAQTDKTDAAPGGELIINLTGIQTDQAGQLIVYLYQGENNWLESELAFYDQIIRVTENDALTIRLTDIPLGQAFAVQIIHDRNSNGTLDFQWFPPKPEEGVGLSNNKFRMGPPDYDDAKIILNKQTKTIQIDMHY